MLLRTRLFQGDDHGAGSEGVPGGAVVGRVEVRLHDVVDGEGGEDGPALRWGFALLHSVPLHQGALISFLLIFQTKQPDGNSSDIT